MPRVCREPTSKCLTIQFANAGGGCFSRFTLWHCLLTGSVPPLHSYNGCLCFKHIKAVYAPRFLSFWPAPLRTFSAFHLQFPLGCDIRSLLAIIPWLRSNYFRLPRCCCWYTAVINKYTNFVFWLSASVEQSLAEHIPSPWRSLLPHLSSTSWPSSRLVLPYVIQWCQSELVWICCWLWLVLGHGYCLHQSG
jgi:hypothetical protein